jgi:PAS domain S-box-containing protein
MSPADDAAPQRVTPATWADYRLLIESVVDYAIFMLDPQGHVASWNRGAEKIKGYRATEIVGAHFSKFYTPEDIAAGKPERELETARELGRVEDEGWRIRKDGSRFWASVVITPLRDEHGELRGFGKVTRDLTARRETDDRLRQSEQRFHHLIDAVIDYAIFMLDTSGHVSTWNSGARRVKGYTAEEIIGQHFSIFYPPEERAAHRPEQILEIVRREGRFEQEALRMRKDGSRFWASVIITALRDEAGILRGFVKVTRDLTERRNAEQIERELLREQTARSAAEKAEGELRKSEERYRALSRRLEIVFEGVADGITVQDRTGHVVLANRAAARMCGFQGVDPLIAAGTAQIADRSETFDEEGRPFSPSSLPAWRVLAGEPSADTTIQIRDRQTGEERWAAIRATAIAGSDGEPELAVNIWHDVTTDRRQEQQLKFLSDVTVALGISLDKGEMIGTLCSLMVPKLGDWCCVYLRDGDALRGAGIAHVDPEKRAAAEDYLTRHVPDPEVEGGAWQVVRTGQSLVINDPDDDLVNRNVPDVEAREQLRRLGLSAVVSVPLVVRERVLGVLVVATGQPQHRYDAAQVALVEEIGRRAGVAVENAQLYLDAQQAAKVAEEASRAKDEFLATVSHELRTPLSAILGWAKLLKDRATDASLTKPLEVIHRNAQAQVKIIDDILDVSRVITGKFKLESKPIDLLSVTRDAIDVVRQSAAAKQIKIELSPEKGYFLLEADPERLQQAAWNLLSNAVKFTEAGGRIEVAVRQEGSQLVLSVKDTGIGIDPRFLPYVFDRFKQADSSTTRRVSGLGLGLALVRHIIELHGGKVAVTSDGPGTGSTFTIALPVRALARVPSDRPAKQRGSPVAPPAAVALRGVRVLIVDDDADARALVTELLAEHGALVERASSAQEAFEAFRRFQPDLVVSDIGMPDEDGFSLIRRIRALPEAEGGKVPAIALTAFARDSDGVKARESGYTAHLGKPVEPDQLVSTIAKHVEKPASA